LIIYEKRIPSSFKDVDKSVRDVLRILENYEGLSDESLLFKVSFVLRELMNNAVEHGNRFDITKFINCIITFDTSILAIEISDEGSGFVISDTYYNLLDDEKRERRRGLKLIEDLNFKIDIDDSTIRLKLNVV
jgi:anti-sigma regulatory factor (Ser/Thr protein kinase)